MAIHRNRHDPRILQVRGRPPGEVSGGDNAYPAGSSNAERVADAIALSLLERELAAGRFVVRCWTCGYASSPASDRSKICSAAVPASCGSATPTSTAGRSTC